MIRLGYTCRENDGRQEAECSHCASDRPARYVKSENAHFRLLEVECSLELRTMLAHPPAAENDDTYVCATYTPSDIAKLTERSTWGILRAVCVSQSRRRNH